MDSVLVPIATLERLERQLQRARDDARQRGDSLLVEAYELARSDAAACLHAHRELVFVVRDRRVHLGHREVGFDASKQRFFDALFQVIDAAERRERHAWHVGNWRDARGEPLKRANFNNNYKGLVVRMLRAADRDLADAIDRAITVRNDGTIECRLDVPIRTRL